MDRGRKIKLKTPLKNIKTYVLIDKLNIVYHIANVWYLNVLMKEEIGVRVIYILPSQHYLKLWVS